jgi:hypothetical protein
MNKEHNEAPAPGIARVDTDHDNASYDKSRMDRHEGDLDNGETGGRGGVQAVPGKSQNEAAEERDDR